VALIKVRDGLIVNSQYIMRAYRCGNYTHLNLKSPTNQNCFEDVWDEDMRLWNAIEQLTEEPPCQR
jgi:hypothetical protein